MSHPAEVSDNCILAFCKMHLGLCGRWGGVLLFSLLSFLLLLHGLCASIPLTPWSLTSPFPVQRHHFGGILVPLLSLKVPAPASQPHGPTDPPRLCEHQGAAQSPPGSELLISVRPLPWEAFALKVISINKPTHALFVSCLGFLWRWESSAGRRASGKLSALSHR